MKDAGWTRWQCLLSPDGGNHTFAASFSTSILFLLASRKCETFSYTRKVIMQAGTTRVRLAWRPL